MRLAVGLGVASAILTVCVAGNAYAQCHPHNVNGNEMDAPSAFVSSFQKQDWAGISKLLNERVEYTLVDESGTSVANGPANVLDALKSFSEHGEEKEEQFIIAGLKLLPNHWVGGRLYSDNPSAQDNPFKTSQGKVEKRIPPPLIFVSPHPRYNPVFSAAFLPDCQGKIQRLVIVDRMAIDG